MDQKRSTSLGAAGSSADLSDDSDYDLLAMMSWRKTDQAIATEAFAVFYRRHVRYLFGVCRRFTEGIGGDDAAEDLVEETFRKVFESGASTFKPGPSRDPEDVRKHVVGWLAAIAENLAKDAFASNSADDRHLEQEHWQDVPEEHASEESPATRQVQELMNSLLTERERFVLRVKFQWYRPGETNQRLPNHVAAGLATELNTTPENVRQIASRAFRKIKEAILRGTDGSPISGQDVV